MGYISPISAVSAFVVGFAVAVLRSRFILILPSRFGPLPPPPGRESPRGAVQERAPGHVDYS